MAITWNQIYKKGDSPVFSAITIKDTDENIVLCCNENEFYVTKIAVGGNAGIPMGLMLVWTYSE